MAIFPGSIPSFAGFTAGDTLSADNHAAQHNLEQGEIVQVATKIGTGSSTPTNNKVLRGNGTGTSTWAQVGLTTDVTGTLPVANGGTGITSLGSGVATFLGTPSSANLASAVTGETGSGALVFATTPTLTTPKVDTINEETADNGVTVDGLNIKDGYVVGSATSGIKNASLGTEAGGLGAAWQSWTPTWTNLTIGNATVLAKYIQIGKTVFFRVQVTLGSSSVMGTAPDFTLPVTASAYNVRTKVCDVHIEDNGASNYRAQGTLLTTTTIGLVIVTAATYISPFGQNITSTNPFPWTTGDYFLMQGFYEAA